MSAKKNVWDHAAALGEYLVNGLGYVTGEDYLSMDLAMMISECHVVSGPPQCDPV